MDAELRVRAATRDDIPLILRLINELAEYERLADEVVATEPDLERHLFGPKPAAEAVLVDAGGEPIGFALFHATFSTFLARPGLWLEDLFVRPEHRGRGAGRALLVHLARLAADRGYGRMEWAALDWNEPALRFYDALGARPVSDWTWLRLDADGIAALARE